MKRNITLISILASICFSNILYSQAGINTITPASTLDITAKTSTGTSTSVEGLLIPRIDRQKAQSMSAVPISTLIYVNSVSTGTQSGTALNIDVVGYYYYNGTAWTKLIAAPINIYNANGTLSGDRIVTQNANKLAFTGTSVNAFSVDASTFSVDAANNRVGMGTIAPSTVLSIFPSTAEGNIDILSLGARNCGIPCGNPEIRNLTLFNEQEWATQFATIDFIAGQSSASPSAATIKGIDRDITNNFAGLQFLTRNSIDFAPRMTLKSSGNIGIGTINPASKLHIVSTTPNDGFQLQDGNEGANKVLMSDNSGKATWITSSSTIATVLGTMNTISKVVSPNTLIGSNITLPPGKWVIYIGQLITTGSAATATNNTWMRITLSSSNSTITNTGYTYLASNLVGGWLPQSNAGGTGYSFLSGVIPIQVTTPTTIYSWFREFNSNGSPPTANVGGNGENYLFASPMN
ncbi:hypothetical protein [Flavobacterium sp. LHD-85]|uniref:hypothetical protein n=1 Tax=Flavobacterium sp. LHD-85 TaxID=3071410 RepID=UPI0027E05B95|nr:hypothetical protein [Flavobacterium sp. LHD-85]MDQ6530956.1 hypothetical protein [Flavobacterium sp. LHD-85]